MPKSSYEQIAGEYYNEGHITSRNFDSTTERALADIPFAVPPQGLILEIGAGRGRAGRFLKVNASRIVQLDSCQEMLNLEDREECLLKVLADACAVPLASQQFQAVVGFLVDPFLGLNCLNEAHRMLVHNGRLLLTTPAYDWGVSLRQQLHLDVMTTRFRILGTEKFVVLPSLLHTPKKLTDMLTHVGFDDIEVHEHCLPSDIAKVSEDISSVCRAKNVDLASLPIVYTIRAKRP